MTPFGPRQLPGLPDDGRPVFGFTRIYLRRVKRRCVTCNRNTRVGTISIEQIGRELMPDFKIMCDACVAAIPDQPTAFDEASIDDVTP